VSGQYAGTIKSKGTNPHACCINPSGKDVTIIRRRIVATGELLIEIRNLVGAAGPAVVLTGGPYGPPDDAAFTAAGSGVVVRFRNVPVTFKGRITFEKGLVGTLTVGPTNLPGNRAAVFTVNLKKVGELP
jgi:hypothetical protein